MVTPPSCCTVETGAHRPYEGSQTCVREPAPLLGLIRAHRPYEGSQRGPVELNHGVVGPVPTAPTRGRNSGFVYCVPGQAGCPLPLRGVAI